MKDPERKFNSSINGHSPVPTCLLWGGYYDFLLQLVSEIRLISIQQKYCPRQSATSLALYCIAVCLLPHAVNEACYSFPNLVGSGAEP